MEGLSLTSFATEMGVFTIQVAYNLAHRYPFNTFGDTVMCWVQTIAIVGLIFVYRSGLPRVGCWAREVGAGPVCMACCEEIGHPPTHIAATAPPIVACCRDVPARTKAAVVLGFLALGAYLFSGWCSPTVLQGTMLRCR